MSQKAKYENTNLLHCFALNRFLSQVGRAIDSVPVTTILDVACAEGFVIKYLKTRRPSLSFKGLDIDCLALAEAKRLNPNIQFECLDIYKLKISEKFDLVMALEVLEHLADYSKALSRIATMDAKFFLFSVPREPFFRGVNFLRG